MVFMFSALLSIDARRQAANRWDVCCCFSSNHLDSEPFETSEQVSQNSTKRIKGGSNDTVIQCKDVEWSSSESELSTSLIEIEDGLTFVPNTAYLSSDSDNFQENIPIIKDERSSKVFKTTLSLTSMPSKSRGRKDFLGSFIGNFTRKMLELKWGAQTVIFLFVICGGWNLWFFIGNEEQWSFNMKDNLYEGTAALDFIKLYEQEGRFMFDLTEPTSGVLFDTDPYYNMETFNSVREQVKDIDGILVMYGWVWAFEEYLKSSNNLDGVNNSFTSFTYSEYIASLTDFLATDGFQYAKDVIIVRDDRNIFSIINSRVWVVNQITDCNTKIRRLKELRSVCRDGGSKICFPFAEYYAYVDGLLEVPNVVNTTALAAMGCMFLIVWCVLGSFYWAAFLTFVVALIAIDFLGTLYLVGSHNDQFKVIGVAMAFGFTVDFNMHLVHRFAHGENSAISIDRIVNAVRQVGSATFNGAFSTLLVFLPALIFPAVMMQWRGSLTFSIVILTGIAHSLFLVPALFMFTGDQRGDEKHSRISFRNSLHRFKVPVWYAIKNDAQEEPVDVSKLEHTNDHLEAWRTRKNDRKRTLSFNLLPRKSSNNSASLKHDRGRNMSLYLIQSKTFNNSATDQTHYRKKTLSLQRQSWSLNNSNNAYELESCELEPDLAVGNSTEPSISGFFPAMENPEELCQSASSVNSVIIHTEQFVQSDVSVNSVILHDANINHSGSFSAPNNIIRHPSMELIEVDKNYLADENSGSSVLSNIDADLAKNEKTCQAEEISRSSCEVLPDFETISLSKGVDG